MSKYAEESRQDLELKLKSINEKINSYANALKILNSSQREILKELSIRDKIERKKVVDEYKEKLQEILTFDEYNIVMCNIDKTIYPPTNIILPDIERVYEELLSYKSKFQNIRLVNFQKSHQIDSCPPVNTYSYKFSIDGHPDLFLGYPHGCISYNQVRYKNALLDINSDENCSFLNKLDKEILAVFLISSGTEISETEKNDLLIKLKAVKNEFPEAKITGISYSKNSNHVIFINF